MLLWILHPGEAIRSAILHAARRGACEAHFLEGWEDVSLRLSKDPSQTPIVVLDPYSDRKQQELDSRILTFRREYPSVPVLPALAVDMRTADHVVTLGRWGAASVIVLPHDLSAGRLERRFSEAAERSALHAVMNALPERLAPRSRAILEAALLTAAAGGTAGHLSARLLSSLRTLERRAAHAGLPAPRQLLAWMRLLLAMRYLEDPGRTVAGAARAAGYAHDVSLHRALSRARLPRASEVREGIDGPLAIAARAFFEQRRARERA